MSAANDSATKKREALNEPLQSFSAWEAGLKAIGYTLAATSNQGSALFSCEGKPSYRLSCYDPNEATACWMRRIGCVDARCSVASDFPDYGFASSDMPEFGLERSDPYHDDLGYVSKSMLSVFADSPVKYRAMYLLGTMPRKKPTRPMKLGSILHAMLLERKTLEETVAVYPYSCYTNGETPRLSTKRAQSYEQKLSPLICVRESDLPTIRTMVAAAMASPFGELLRTHSGRAKFETRVDGELCGVKVKCKPDLHVILDDQIIVPDLKFTALFGKDEFERTARRFQYALQAVHYSAILQQAYGLPVSWSFFVGETVPPHRFGVREFDTRSMEIAAEYHRDLLTQLKRCRETGEWRDTFDTTMTIAPWEIPGGSEDLAQFEIGGSE